MAAEGGRAPLLPAEARPCAPRRPRAPAPPGGRCHRAVGRGEPGVPGGLLRPAGALSLVSSSIYARGAQWDYFVWCQLHLLVLQCPPLQLSVPERGCPVGGGPRKRLLLTADGLASPRSQSVFQEFVKEGRDDWGKRAAW
ncbi:unnamed protein product [Prorocentrum cordatum]|uniref:Uncharacterized protein n=1 Tax=Prorocentrum cordatum TaxID=2364126 RepID=A0ABN9WM01_9DINO|nr:unnamed protein product [Polarella glacialis]